MKATRAPLALALALAVSACGGTTNDAAEKRDGLPAQEPAHEVRAVAAGREGVWVGNHDGTVQRVDARAGRRGRALAVGTGEEPVADIAVGGGSVWVLLPRHVVELDKSGRLIRRVPTPVRRASAIAWSADGVWAVGPRAAVRVDPASVEADNPIPVRGGLGLVAIDRGVVYLPVRGRIARLDARTGEPAGDPLTSVGDPGPIAVRGGVGWVLDRAGSPLLRTDVRRDRRIGRALPVEDVDGLRVAAGPDGVFVLARDRVVRFDERTGKLAGATALGSRGADIAVHDGVLWVVEDGAVGLRRVPLG